MVGPSWSKFKHSDCKSTQQQQQQQQWRDRQKQTSDNSPGKFLSTENAEMENAGTTWHSLKTRCMCLK